MRDSWKPVEVILPEDLEPQQILDNINAQIRVNAAEAGDFVQRVSIGASQLHSPGWLRWPSAYLPGPPGVFPAARPDRVD